MAYWPLKDLFASDFNSIPDKLLCCVFVSIFEDLFKTGQRVFRHIVNMPDQTVVPDGDILHGRETAAKDKGFRWVIRLFNRGTLEMRDWMFPTCSGCY